MLEWPIVLKRYMYSSLDPTFASDIDVTSDILVYTFLISSCRPQYIPQEYHTCNGYQCGTTAFRQNKEAQH
jgi:hypothetical protein